MSRLVGPQEATAPAVSWSFSMKKLDVEFLAVWALVSISVGIGYYLGRGDGQASVQSQWDAQKLIDTTESDRLAREASAEQLSKFRNSERVSDEQASRDALRAQRFGSVADERDSLRNTLEAINQRDLSTTPTDAGAAACAGEAATARELFGSCAEVYISVAQQAEGLRDQVTGLLDFTQSVCQSYPSKTQGRP